VSERAEPPKAFFLYRGSALRREALTRAPGDGQRYCLFGLDETAAAGFEVSHNLVEGRATRPAARLEGYLLDRAVRLGGGYSGDFATVLASRGALNEADVVFSTVDTVGIPLVLLAGAKLVRAPIVYVAIGLPERIEQLAPRIQRLYARLYRRVHTIIAYGAGEVDALRTWLGDNGPLVDFVPFGVDPDVFRPTPAATVETDVVSVGSDPRRDFPLLLALAARRSEWSFRIVASSLHASALRSRPPNVTVEIDLAFDLAQERLAGGRVVVLPVKDNSYSGATTTLLQAMARAKPVVVSRTAAIERGYHLQDGLNCRLVQPGALAALEHAVSDLMSDRERAAIVGARARETVEEHLTWRRYTDAIREHLSAACEASTVPA
jgi:glycosyltransferase involved in cell wall biosynthesis